MAVPAASESGGAAAEKGFLAKMKKTKRRMVGVDGTVKYSCLKSLSGAHGVATWRRSDTNLRASSRYRSTHCSA